MDEKEKPSDPQSSPEDQVSLPTIPPPDFSASPSNADSPKPEAVDQGSKTIKGLFATGVETPQVDNQIDDEEELEPLSPELEAIRRKLLPKEREPGVNPFETSVTGVHQEKHVVEVDTSTNNPFYAVPTPPPSAQPPPTTPAPPIPAYSGPPLALMPLEEDSKANIKELVAKLKGLSGVSESERAEIYLGIGKELLPHIAANDPKISVKDATWSALRVYVPYDPDLTVIPHNTLSEILRLIKFKDIDKWTWLGWNNLVLATKIIKKNNPALLSKLIDDIYDSKLPNVKDVDVGRLNKLLKLYPMYQHLASVCNFKSGFSLKFLKYVEAFEKGIDLHSEENIKELKKRSRIDNFVEGLITRKDDPLTIDAYIQDVLKGGKAPIPNKKTLTAPKEKEVDTKSLIDTLTKDMRKRIIDTNVAISIPQYQLEEFILTAIDYFNEVSIAMQLKEDLDIEGDVYCEPKIYSRRTTFERIIEHINSILEEDKK